MKAMKSWLLAALITGGVLFYALRLSAPGRNRVDWIVLGVVGAGLMVSLTGLGVRLVRRGGARELGHIGRTALFWTAGLTAEFGPGRLGIVEWELWLGRGLLSLAVLDSLWLYRKERRALKPPGEDGSSNRQ